MVEDIVWLMLLIPDTKGISYIPVFDTETIFFFIFLLLLSFLLAGFKITDDLVWRQQGEVKYRWNPFFWGSPLGFRASFDRKRNTSGNTPFCNNLSQNLVLFPCFGCPSCNWNLCLLKINCPSKIFWFYKWIRVNHISEILGQKDPP